MGWDSCHLLTRNMYSNGNRWRGEWAHNTRSRDTSGLCGETKTFTASKVKDERGCFLSINVSECKNQKKRKLLKLKDNCIPRTSGYKLTIKEFSLEIRRKLLAIRAISSGTVSNGRGKERRPACFKRIWLKWKTFCTMASCDSSTQWPRGF